MYVLVDASAILKRALFAGKDLEFGYEEQTLNEAGEEVNTWINSAQYGFDNATSMVQSFLNETKTNPKDLIIVLEGTNSTQFRKSFYPNYKSGRTKSVGLYREYNKLEEMFIETMLNLGAQVASHPGVEADDLIAWLAENIKSEQIMVWSSDGDLAILGKYPNVTTYINQKYDHNPFGEFPVEFLDVYKATVGDTSDKIKGAPRFGAKAFEQLYSLFGDNGLAVLRELILSRSLIKLSEDVEKCKPLQILIDNAQEVELSYKCAKLHTDLIQASSIEWQHGLNMGNTQIHPNLNSFAQQVVGVTQSNFAQVFKEIQRISTQNHIVVLDIETTTSEESDEWLNRIAETKTRKDASIGVDVFGSELVSVQLTLGGNFQYTYDFSINHAETDNISLQQLEQVLIFLNNRHRFVIHNVNFELTVLHNTFGWFLRDIDDTKIMASYVDENEPLGLKQNSKRWLNYEQTTYEQTVTDAQGNLRKMHQLTLAESLKYAADDTICTAALYQWFRLFMLLEHSWNIYRDVEIDAAYWTAQAFLDGMNINLATLAEFSKRDSKQLEDLQETIYAYLTKAGWEGSVYTPLTYENYQEASSIKYAYQIVTGEPFKTRKKKFEAILEELHDLGETTLHDLLLDGDIELLNQYIKSKFSGKPEFNFNSPTQIARLLYEVMGLPVRLRNKRTETQKAKGLPPSAKTDAAAIETALLKDVTPNTDQHQCLDTLLNIKLLQTRINMYYRSYPAFPHWRDNKIHASLNQCGTVTRRFTSTNPNLQQFPKTKGDFRKVLVPHHKGALIVSLDFSAQELRLLAEASKDENLLSCYIGDNLKDMHALTAAQMIGMSYEEFKAIQSDENHPRHDEISNVRKAAKTVNFGTNYGIEAPSLAIKLQCSEEEAQRFIDSKDAAFPGVVSWKIQETDRARSIGYSLTMLGARRHLDNINSSDYGEASKGERQAVNFVIQGSGAEMTKLAMGRMFRSGIRQNYDMRFLAVIHDEAVFSIAIEDMPEVIPQIYAAMTAPYANMTVPVQSSVSIGSTFGDQHELGDNVVPTPENIRALIEKVTKPELSETESVRALIEKVTEPEPLAV